MSGRFRDERQLLNIRLRWDSAVDVIGAPVSHYS